MVRNGQIELFHGFEKMCYDRKRDPVPTFVFEHIIVSMFQFARKIIFLKLASVVNAPDLTEHFFFLFSFSPLFIKRLLPLVTRLMFLTQKHPSLWRKRSLTCTDTRESIKIYFVDPDWLHICIFSRMAHYHMRFIYAHVWAAFLLCCGKKVCGCHRASCDSFLLGWHAGLVLCHGASWDIMWAYQVAIRVSGGVWVT